MLQQMLHDNHDHSVLQYILARWNVNDQQQLQLSKHQQTLGTRTLQDPSWQVAAIPLVWAQSGALAAPLMA